MNNSDTDSIKSSAEMQWQEEDFFDELNEEAASLCEEERRQARKQSNEKRFQQNLENLPDELLNQPRWFEVGADKVPITKGWSNPDNQKSYTEVDGYKGFDTVGHGKAADYLLFDYDHCLDDNGEFVNAEAEDWYQSMLIAFGDCYRESSKNDGLHVLVKPTPGKFGKITNGKNGVLYFDRDKDIKLEIFYINEARYCLLTGNCYECNPKAPIPQGEVVDDVVSDLLKAIAKQYPDDDTNITPARNHEDNSIADDLGQEYDLFRAPIMLDAIKPEELSDGDWLAVNSACKNIGVPYNVLDAFNRRDPKRYNAEENQKRYDSTNKPSFNIATLHGIAKRFGYKEKDARRQWYKLHPELSQTSAQAQEEFSESDKKAYPLDRKIFQGGSDDYRNGHRIAEYGRDKILWLTDDEKWFVYQNGIWLRRSEKNSAIQPVIDDMVKAMTIHAVTNNEKYIASIFTKQKKVNPALFFLKGCDEILITADDLNAHKNLVAVQNGVINLQTGEWFDFNPTYLITNQINAVYNPKIDTRFVEEFFEAVLPDEATRNAVLRYLGYCLTGEKNFHISEFWRGNGSNGKSTILDLLILLFGSYAVKLPSAALLESRRPLDSNSATPALAQLDGDKRLAIVDELPRNSRLDAALFKTITGDQTTYARALYCNPRQIELRAKLILNGNHLPTFDVDDGGMLRRINNVEFTEKFGEGYHRADPQLLAKLAEPDNRSALLTILVAEAQKYYSEGLLESTKMKEAKAVYCSESDFISEFISEYCDVGNGGETTRKNLEDKISAVYPVEFRRLKPKERFNLLQERLKAAGAEYMKNRLNQNVWRNVILIPTND